jgi:hypothetical protein
MQRIQRVPIEQTENPDRIEHIALHDFGGGAGARLEKFRTPRQTAHAIVFGLQRFQQSTADVTGRAGEKNKSISFGRSPYIIPQATPAKGLKIQDKMSFLY